MPRSTRKSGIPQVGEIPLGTHLCHFFETEAELYDTVVPFLVAGIDEGEVCLWLLAQPLTVASARRALAAAVPDLDRKLTTGAVALQPAAPWYLRNGELDMKALGETWDRLVREAHDRAYTAVRIAGCVSWVPELNWPLFQEYEEEFEEAVAGKPMIVLCSYPVAQCDAARFLEVASTHRFALVSRDGRPELIETPVRRLRQLDVRNRRQAATAELGLTAIRERDLGVLMNDAVALAAETLGTGRSILWRVRHESDDMILCASAGWGELPPDATVEVTDGSAARFVISNDQPVLVTDIPVDTRFQSSWLLRQYKVATLLTAVVRGRERPWGLLSVHSLAPRSFDADDMEFLQSMANVLALALERSEHERALQREKTTLHTTLAKLHAIQSITDTALGHMALDDLLTELLARLRNTLQADTAAVLMLDEQRASFTILAIDGFPLSRLASAQVPVDSTLSSRIIKERKAMIFDTVPNPGSHWTASFGVLLRAAMGAPLVVEGKIIGVVVVTSATDRHFSEDDLELLRVVADRVAPAIERARLIEAVRAGRERLELLSRRLLTVQEEERRRVAIELHDELGQVLTAIKINLAQVPAKVGEAVESVDGAMQTVRDLALDLRPAMLDDLGLGAALRWYADRFARQTEVETHLAVEEVPRLDPRIATALFRVAQEALTNVARHASAKNVWLDLRRANGSLELVLRDDGTGFDVADASQRATHGESLGLIGMEERVSLAGGRLSIRSAPGDGAEIRARFPLVRLP